MQCCYLDLSVVLSFLLLVSAVCEPVRFAAEAEVAGTITAVDAVFASDVGLRNLSTAARAPHRILLSDFVDGLPATLRPPSRQGEGRTFITLEEARALALRAVIANAPKVELHTHLDGSMSPETVWRIGQAVGFKFPKDVHDAEGLIPYVTAPHSASLADFLKTFNFFFPIISGKTAVRAMEIMAEAFAQQQVANNVVYSEARFAPQLLTSENVTSQMLVDAAWRGLRKGLQGSRVDVRLIMCCYRNLPPAACGDIVELAAANRGKVVGVDLAGDEMAFSNEPWIEYFEDLFKRGINRTIHSGESGTNSTRDCETALTKMYADRIGHGYHCLSYANAVAILQKGQVHLEACPSSSVGTHATGPLGPDHPIAQFEKLGLNFGLNTDDAGVLGTNMTHEFEVAQDLLNFSLAQLSRATEAAAAHAFISARERFALLGEVQSYWSTVRELAQRSSTMIV